MITLKELLETVQLPLPAFMATADTMMKIHKYFIKVRSLLRPLHGMTTGDNTVNQALDRAWFDGR